MSKDNMSIFLSDYNGGYLSINNPNNSHYQGWYIFDNEKFETKKLIENITLNEPYDKILQTTKTATRFTGKAIEEFTFKKNTLNYNINNYTGHIVLTLDIRFVHDFDDKGRIYTVYTDKNYTYIKYQKFSDDSQNNLLFEDWIAIKGDVHIDKIEEWTKKEYSYDKSRHTKHDFYVFKALHLLVDKEAKIYFGYGKNKQEAKNNCKKIAIKKEDKNDTLQLLNNSLEALLVNFHGTKRLFAGLPWFYQIWSRDELTSLGGFIANKQYSLVKKILLAHLNNLEKNNLVGNRYPSADLISADATGWLYKRIFDMLKKEAFTYAQIKNIDKIVKKTIKYTRDKYLVDGLIYNESKETWMDTTNAHNQDGRDGFRIEIQALHMSMYELAMQTSKITKNDDFKIYEKYAKELKKEINSKLVDNNILLDGLNSDKTKDHTLRPNVFLAKYISENIVSKEIWTKTFKAVLKECWLEWGGLTSISKKSPLYIDMHTGINNESYHRGDSWYFVNNIAAIELLKLNKPEFKTKAKKIYKASIHEMLNLGWKNCCAEISSAKEQKSQGCNNQAWSVATLVELTIYLYEN